MSEAGPGKYPEYTRARVADVLARVTARVHADRAALDTLLAAGPVDRIPYAEAQGLDYRALALGTELGPLWSTWWVRIAADVPAAWAGSRVDLLWDSGSEATLWLGGRAVQGLVGGDLRRPVASLLDAAPAGGTRVEAQLEVASNPYFGYDGQSGRPVRPARLHEACVARFDADAWGLSHDLRVLAALEADGVDPSWAGALLAGLNDACNLWEAGDLLAARSRLAPLLATRNGGHAHELSATGHAHLDTAWLWPLEESWRKAQRTLTTQLRLIGDYPEHRFAVSSAQHLAWVRDRDPALWEDVRRAIAAGSVLPVGGSWIEPDCNLPAGESLVRQLLLGQRFFESELGGRATAFWNPDVFGYCNQLPQILAGAGLTRFLTQKLSWNRFTTPPSHTFEWEGLDGTRVLTHFPPANTYNAAVTVDELRRSARDYKDHTRSRHGLLLFGHGDGGGGPTPEMLETLRRVRDLQEAPRTTLRSPDAFFDALEAEPGDPPVMVGELYLEYHRGTYTSQARIKRGNRAAEAALHDAELLWAVAARRGASYPHEALRGLWETLALNQFHDILPGSSIAAVNARAREDLDGVVAAANALADRAPVGGRATHEDAVEGGRATHEGGAAAVGGDATLAGRGAAATGGGLVPVNTAPVARRAVVAGPEGGLVHVTTPAYGPGTIDDGAPHAVALQPDGDGWRMSTGGLVVRVARDGTIASLVLDGREALAAPANVLELYDDHPTAFDAWDVDPFHLETGRPLPGAESARVVTDDPLRAEIAFEHAVGEGSRLTQTIRLDAGARAVECHTRVDWHERHRMLKVAFPLAVRDTEATYETAFGAVRRPTHWSTAADMARYEVPAHRWADLSEHGFGVALLNDGKYGHSCHDGTLRLSLLRAPTYPDPEADQGEHEFAYALLPHRGGWRDAGVVGAARAFNQPLRWLPAGAPASWFATDTDDLVLDTVKAAEDSGALVLRLYEAHGARGAARVRVGLPFSTARRANLLEDPGEPLTVDGDEVLVPFRPHEILTLLVD